MIAHGPFSLDRTQDYTMLKRIWTFLLSLFLRKEKDEKLSFRPTTPVITDRLYRQKRLQKFTEDALSLNKFKFNGIVFPRDPHTRIVSIPEELLPNKEFDDQARIDEAERKLSHAGACDRSYLDPEQRDLLIAERKAKNEERDRWISEHRTAWIETRIEAELDLAGVSDPESREAVKKQEKLQLDAEASISWIDML